MISARESCSGIVSIPAVGKPGQHRRALKKAIDDKNRQRDIGVQNIPESERQYYVTNCKVQLTEQPSHIEGKFFSSSSQSGRT